MEAAIAAGGAIDLPPGCQALFVGRSYYGCVVTVLPPLPTVHNKVRTTMESETAISTASMFAASLHSHGVGCS